MIRANSEDSTQDVTVRIALGSRSILEGEADRLAIGSVIELDSRPQEHVDVLVDGRRYGRGEPVAVELPGKGARLGVIIRELAQEHRDAGRYVGSRGGSVRSGRAGVATVAMSLIAALVLMATSSDALCQNAPTSPQTSSLEKSATDTRPVSPSDNRPVGKASTSNGQFEMPQLAQTLLALAAVVALIFATRWLLRRMGRRGGIGSQSQVISVLARGSLGGNYNLALVKLGGRLVLIGCCGTNMSRLSETSDPAEVAAVTQLAETEQTSSLKNLFKSRQSSGDSSTRQLADKIRKRLGEGQDQ